MCNGTLNFYLSTLYVNQISNDLKLPSHTSAVLHALLFVREPWEWTAASHLGNRRETKLLPLLFCYSKSKGFVFTVIQTLKSFRRISECSHEAIWTILPAEPCPDRYMLHPMVS